MTPATTGLSEVYLRLASIVQRPEAFGLGASAPQPLTDTLEAMMQTLGQVIDEKEQPIPEEDLEKELSQDADQPVAC